jgi:hypothetical protein
VLLVGNGKNLSLTPPERFGGYPSFGMNTIHRYEGWKPNYYTAVDSRVMREFGREIVDALGDIPKFIPRPNLDDWRGPGFYRFYHRPGPLVSVTGKPMNWRDLMSEEGISYGNIMHVAMQLAAWMGFTTLLVIGMQHKPLYAQDHFWGCDHGMSATPPVEQWLVGYAELVGKFTAEGIRVLNISEDTYVPEYVIPRGNWKDWTS